MPRIWYGTGSAWALFMLLAWYAAYWLGLSGRDLWLFRIGLWLLGTIAAALVLVFLRARARSKPEAAPADDELDGLFAAARKRLAGARKGGRLGVRPLILLTGPQGSAKTTIFARSGLEPELLAGEVWRGDQIAATRAVNVWYASDAVWVEAGGPLLADESRWGRLVRHLQPKRAAAVFARGAQAPRLAVVCFGCDEFLKPGAAESVAAAAQRVRARLIDTARRLGIRLPVYVVFTKADRIPFFLDYVRSLTQEEAQALLGATLPIAPPVDAGGHNEREGARLDLAFSRMLGALALRRLEVLPRESGEEVRAGAYEFPRELRKLAPLATRFLIDLCRPSQLGASPFLRGFYFTGVRPVVVADAAAPAVHAPTAPRAADATAVFDARAIVRAAQPAQPAGGTRRVPEWTFLPRIFHQIVLRDRVAMAVTAGGARVDLLRRVLAGAALAVLLLLALGLVRSFAGNRALVREAERSARTVQPIATTGASLAPIEDLQRLDSLRATTTRLRTWQQDGRPFRLGFGLYTGNAILPELRTLYFHRFGRSVWAHTRDDLRATLRSLPAEPSEAADYGTTYDALKAYLITTSHPQYSTSEFLTPVLITYWRANRQPEPERVDLAARQFDFFADELPFGNPYDDAPEERLVADARDYLGRFADENQFYQALLAGASGAGASAVQFHRMYPGSEQAVRADGAVPAAFTKGGWAYVHASLEDVDALFDREAWVVGDRAVAPGDRQRLATQLRQRYEREYIAAWTAFLGGAAVLGYQSTQDAARKLARLSDNQSPLLQLLAVTARNTDVDTTAVRRAFQPVHTVMPPEVTDRFITDANQGYIQGLAGMGQAVNRAATATGPAQIQALEDAGMAAEQVRFQVQQIAQNFSVADDARPVSEQVRRLMEAPIAGVEVMARRGPGAAVNNQAAAFCRDFSPLLALYPFNRAAGREVSADDVAAMFKPGASKLASFEGEALQGVVAQQGNQWGSVPGAPVQPTAEFLRYYNRLKSLQRALFAPDGSGPEAAFTLRPLATEQLPEIVVTIDGQRQEVSARSQASRAFVWESSRADDARIDGLLANGSRVTLFSASGPWAVFRMFHAARWQQVSPGRYTVTWSFTQPPVTLTAELTFDRGIGVFDPGFLSGLSCVSRVAN